MNIGKLKHRVEIQYSIDTYDEFGAISGQTWNTLYTTWASVEPLVGREYFAATQIQSEVTHKIKMRHKSVIKPYYRAFLGNRIFDILSILNISEENRELVLYCKEVTSP